MSTKFNLTLTIEGESLDDIDNFLIKAAGERLKSRMVKPFTEPTFVTNPTVLRPETPPATIGPKKRGRPAGAKNKDEKHADQIQNAEASSEQSTDNGDEEAPDSSGEGASETPQSAPQAAQARTFTQDEVVQALKSVNSKFNVDKARECLAHFNVKRCGDLTEDQRGLFVKHCENLCG